MLVMEMKEEDFYYVDFKVELPLKFEERLVHKGIVIESLDGVIRKTTIEVTAKDGNEAVTKARTRLEEFVLVLSHQLRTAVKIVSLLGYRQSEQRKYIGIRKITAAALIVVKDGDRIRKAIDTLDQVSNLDGETQKITKYALKWYYRGLMEDDHLDRFINFWIALEALGKHFFPGYRDTQKVECTLARFGCKNPDNWKNKRGALFHAGIEKDVKKILPELQNIVHNAISAIIS